jgi:hypothetical protein
LLASTTTAARAVLALMPIRARADEGSESRSPVMIQISKYDAKTMKNQNAILRSA